MRILCYHAFEDFAPGSPLRDYGVPVDLLRRQLGAFTRWGYRFIDPEELHASLTGRREIGPRDLAVTIDDGYATTLDARSVFDDFAVKPLLFTVAGELGGRSRWMRDELALLTVDEIRELHRCGWEIGSHSVTHPFLTSLDDDELWSELDGSRRTLLDEGIGPIRALAYPHGLHDARVRAATAAAGYDFGFVLEGGEVATATVDRCRIERLEVLRSYSPAFLRLLLALPGPMTRRLLAAERNARRVGRRLHRFLRNRKPNPNPSSARAWPNH